MCFRPPAPRLTSIAYTLTGAQSRQSKSNGKIASPTGNERTSALAEWHRKEKELRPQSKAGKAPTSYSPQAYYNKSPYAPPTSYTGPRMLPPPYHQSGGRSSGTGSGANGWASGLIWNAALSGGSGQTGDGGSGGGGCDSSSGGGASGGGGDSCN